MSSIDALRERHEHLRARVQDAVAAEEVPNGLLELVGDLLALLGAVVGEVEHLELELERLRGGES